MLAKDADFGYRLRRNQIRCKALHTWFVFTCHHYRRSHRWMLQEDRLNFSKLNTKSANFYLMIDAPQVLDVSSRQKSCQIARFIKLRAFASSNVIPNKTLLGKLR